MNKTIKNLIIKDGNYITEEKIELWGFNSILKSNYKQTSSLQSKDLIKENKFYVISEDTKKDIYSLINKINFEEKASDNDYFEGGSAGSLTVVFEDNTTLTKEFGAYMQDDITNLYELIINSLNIDALLDVEWILTKLIIYYVIATSSENQTITLSNCFDVLQHEINLSKENDTLFNKLPGEHPVTQLYNAFDGMDVTTYTEIIKSIMLKIKYYDKICSSRRLMTFFSNEEVDEFAYEILNLNKGTDELKSEISSNIYAMNELGERYSYAGMHDKAFELFNDAANKGHKIAMYNKIWSMYYGKGTEKNHSQAFVELSKLVEKIGFPHATLLLGQMYYQGHGVEKDYNLAYKCFKDIEEFNAEAKYYLGEMYLKGYGVQQNKEIATSYMEKSAKEKCLKAINYLIESDKNINLLDEKILDDTLEKIKIEPPSEIDLEFQKYCKLYEDKFKKQAYIAEPSGTKEKTIEAIKICLEKGEDLLDKLLFPKFKKDFSQDDLKNIFYHNMSEQELEKINDLDLNDMISELQSPTYKIKYIENIGYILIGEGYLILDDGTEPTHYFAKIFNTAEETKQEIINIYNKRKNK